MKTAAFLTALFLPTIAMATVPSTTRTYTYSPSTPTTEFTVPFHFLASGDLRVTKTTIATGADDILTEGSDQDYTVTLPVGSYQGKVTTTVSVTSTHTLTIERFVSLKQLTSFRSQGRYNPKAHEDAHDKAMMAIQQLAVSAVDSTDISTAIAAHEAEADPHTVYHAVAGRAGGQYATGGTASGENLTLRSTAHATKGKVILGSLSAYDEVNDRLGIGTTSPATPIHLTGSLMSEGASSYAYVNGDTGFFGAMDATAPLQLVAWDSALTADGAILKLYPPTHATKPNYLEIETDSLSIADVSANSLLVLSSSGAVLADVPSLELGSAGGGTLYGGDSSGDNLTLKPNSGASNGKILIGTGSAYDEANGRLGVGTLGPQFEVEVDGQIAGARRGLGFTSDTNADACNGIYFSGTNNTILRLPDTTTVPVGCEITLVLATASKYSYLSPELADEIVGYCGATTFNATGKDARNTSVTVGDTLTVVKHKDNQWMILDCNGTWVEEP